jgi:hypothetical protein
MLLPGKVHYENYLLEHYRVRRPREKEIIEGDYEYS